MWKILGERMSVNGVGTKSMFFDQLLSLCLRTFEHKHLASRCQKLLGSRVVLLKKHTFDHFMYFALIMNHFSFVLAFGPSTYVMVSECGFKNIFGRSFLCFSMQY